MVTDTQQEEALEWSARTDCALCWQKLSGRTLARVCDDGAGVLACHASHGEQARLHGFVIPVASFPPRPAVPAWACVTDHGDFGHGTGAFCALGGR